MLTLQFCNLNLTFRSTLGLPKTTWLNPKKCKEMVPVVRFNRHVEHSPPALTIDNKTLETVIVVVDSRLPLLLLLLLVVVVVVFVVVAVVVVLRTLWYSWDSSKLDQRLVLEKISICSI